MKAESILSVLMLAYVVTESFTGTLGSRYDFGCGDSPDNSTDIEDAILRHSSPTCDEGGLWRHYQCTYASCHCVYIDTGRRFSIGNTSLIDSVTQLNYWSEVCPVTTERSYGTCDRPPITYPCSLQTIKYVFNDTIRQCVPTTGCAGFSTAAKCERLCVTPEITQPKCTFTMNSGRVCSERQSSTRFWYNATSGTCQSFHHLGCGGNLNNYPSIWVCKQSCVSQQNVTVLLHIDRPITTIYQLIVPTWIAEKHSLSATFSILVSRSAYEEISRYALRTERTYQRHPLMKHFDPEEERRLFPSRIICSLSPITFKLVQCRAANSRWYFDPRRSRCIRFYFCGRISNGNNFETEEECVAYCSV